MNQTPPQQNTNEKTRAQKEGTSWLKIVLITIGVFILIGVLAVGLAFWIMSSSVENARSGATDARVQSGVNQLQTSLEIYANQNGQFPETLDEAAGEFSRLSEHPVEGESYQYTQTNGGNGYCVGAV